MPTFYITWQEQLSERAIPHRIELEQAYVTDPKLKIGHSAKKKKKIPITLELCFSISVSLNKQVDIYLRHIR